MKTMKENQAMTGQLNCFCVTVDNAFGCFFTAGPDVHFT